MTKEFDARNAEKSRAVCEAMAERADTGKRKLTERERRILAMWPRYEDGEPVWIGDDVSGMDVRSFVFTESGAMVTNLTSVPAYGECRKYGEPFKRPAPKVLDADGVEIKVGDTVWTLDGLEGVVTRVEDGAAYIAYKSDYAQCEEATSLTHVQPDSWERFVEDLQKSACTYFGYQHKSCDEGDGCPARGPLDCRDCRTADLVRRANALAGLEVADEKR